MSTLSPHADTIINQNVFLGVVCQSQTEDGIRKELLALQEDKHNYETTAKESLRRVLQEKIEVVRKLSEVEVRPEVRSVTPCSHKASSLKLFVTAPACSARSATQRTSALT